MDGKIKVRSAGTIPKNVGRPTTQMSVGVSVSQRRRVSSSSRKAGPSSSSSASSMHNGPATGGDVDGEQDIKFIDVASFDLPSRVGANNDRKPDVRFINPEEILHQAQESDFNRVYEIDLHAACIARIENLEKFKKLKILDLSSNHINKIENLETNVDIKELKLYDNRIQIIENVDRLRELCSLQLQHNKIRSIGKSLNILKKLKILRLDNNNILKLEPAELAGCSQVISIDVGYNMLDNLTALNSLPNLEELCAAGNRMRSVTDLGRCRKLQELDLVGNMITDLSGLKSLSQLQILDVTNNQLTSLKSIGKLRCLRELNASRNKLVDISYVSDYFPNLEIFNVCDNRISQWEHIESLQKLSQLVELFISGNPFCDAEGPKPSYHGDVQRMMLNLEILDGANIKRSNAKTGPPLMRPMSASSIVSVRQMECQLEAVKDELASFEKSMSRRFDSIRMGCQTLPAEPPVSARSSTQSAEAISRCSSRSRIRDAQVYASENF